MQGTEDWLSLKRPKRKYTKRGTSVAATTKLPQERGRAKAMQRKLFGKDRIWSCDGEYVYFRPTRMIGGVKTVVANPTTYERHKRFLAEGQYTHVETQDDVEIYKVSPDSPFARKGLYLGELSDADVRRQVVRMACQRDWVAYTDCLEELFGRLKNRGYDANFGAAVREDYLKYIEIQIAMRGGPAPEECASGLTRVRKNRGDSQGRMILLPPVKGKR